MSALYLSRARLKTSAPMQALASVLLPDDDNARTGVAHRLVWSLFADRPDRRRDFLWREDGGGDRWGQVFHLLSARPPVDAIGLFDLDPPKLFEPNLTPGDRLRFRLRANAAGAERGKRVDPVARALRDLDTEQRARDRVALTQKVAADWLDRQGQVAGFVSARADNGVPILTVTGTDWRVVPRDGDKPLQYAVLDLDGEIEVRDPAAFVAALARGFGRAKAFGCGLMLIRRAVPGG